MLGRKSPSLQQAVVLASLLLSCCLSGFAQSRVTVRREEHRDVSPPLREMIKLTSTSGVLTHGNTATATATVWAWSAPSADALDLYYTANANSPSWVLIGTIVPTVAGSQSISRTFTLPTGSVQAVRAQFRYQGTASSCTAGSYNDHDDLIFAVN